MKVDALTLELRPRSMTEATDLGVRMVQANARSSWRCFAPVYAVVVALAFSTMDVASWLPSLLIFWFKPWLDRTLLFVMSRAVFGQATGYSDLWRARREVWWQRLPVTLTFRRLSLWRSYTQPVEQLEGQRGAAWHRRCRMMLNEQRSRAWAMQAVFSGIELSLVIGLLAMAAWFWLPGHDDSGMGWIFGNSTGAVWLSTLAYAAVVLFLEPYYVAAGFAMYLNRRVQLEAWDVEKEFRRAFG
jgi:hypothetical protein